MTGFDTAHPRFLRPIDVARIRRNQNRIHVQRVLRIARNLTFTLMLIVLGVWLYQRTQSDARFAVRTIEVAGIVNSPRADVEQIVGRYRGVNLFRIDIDDVQSDLRQLSWIDRIAIEKKLPDTLRIRVTERVPVALARVGSELRYVDEHGAVLATLSPAVGNPDLPLITGASERDMRRCVAVLRHLSRTDPELYSHISEVKPLAPDAFAFFDRELTAFVYATPDLLSQKWRTFRAIARAERLSAGSIAYADLRFNDRIVIKPREGAALHQGVTDATH